jgi:hypothetical protein
MMKKVGLVVMVVLAFASVALARVFKPSEFLDPLTVQDPAKVAISDLTIDMGMRVSSIDGGNLYLAPRTPAPRTTIVLTGVSGFAVGDYIRLIWRLTPVSSYRARWTYRLDDASAEPGTAAMQYFQGRQKALMTLTLRIESKSVQAVSGRTMMVHLGANCYAQIISNVRKDYKPGGHCRIKAFLSPIGMDRFTIRSFIPLENMDTRR